MNKTDFEKKIKKMGLEKITSSNLEQVITKSTYYSEKKRDNFYGFYQNKKKKFVIFFKDPERGIVTELGEYDTEEEAYDKLIAELKESDFVE